MTRVDMIKVIAEYISMRDEDSEIHTDPDEASEYIVGCFETFLERDDFWKDASN